MYKDLQNQINRLNKKICCVAGNTGGITESPLVIAPDFASFPELGDETKLYIDLNAGLFYLWYDGEYISTGYDHDGYNGLYNNLQFVSRIEELPPIAEASMNMIYINTSTGVAYYSDGAKYVEFGTNIPLTAAPYSIDFPVFHTNAHLNNFVDGSAGTLTMSGSELVVGGTATVLTSNSINYPVDFMGDNWEMSCKIRATVSGASQVFALGIRNTNTRGTTKKELSLAIDISNGANKGLATIFTGNSGTFVSRVSTAGNLLPINANDLILLQINRNGATINATVTNLTQAVSRNLTYTYPIQSTSDPVLPNIGRPCFYQLSQQDVNVLSFSFYLYPNYIGQQIDVLIHGDSKTEGYNTTSNADRYTELLKASFSTKNIISMAGFADETADTLKILPHIIRMKPKVLVFAMGSNDVRNSVTDNVLYNNMLTVYNTCKQNNIKVIFLGMAEGVISQANYWEKARLIFGDENCVFTYPALAGDNVHLTTAGHLTVANALTSKIIANL